MQKQNGSARWILVVEDDQDIAELLQSFLEFEGFNVIVSRDGEEGENVFRTHKPRFDLVLTDLGLPKVSGVELFQRLRQLDPTVKVIASSGYGQSNVVRQLLNDGIKAFVPKPYRPQELLQLIHKILDS